MKINQSINRIIMWQGSLKVNASVLNSSFLVGILPRGPPSCMETVISTFFVFECIFYQLIIELA